MHSIKDLYKSYAIKMNSWTLRTINKNEMFVLTYQVKKEEDPWKIDA